MNFLRINRLALLLLLAAPACAPLASVKIRDARYQPINCAQACAEAKKCRKKDPRRALGDYLAAARTASQVLKAHPHDEAARQDYNYATARAVEAMVAAAPEAGSHAVTVPSDSGDFVVSTKLPPASKLRLSDFELYAADTLVIGGTSFKDRPAVVGVGAPFAAYSKVERKDFRKDYGWKKEFGTTTAVVRFSGPGERNAQVEFLLPLFVEKVSLNGNSYTLAADFNAPLAIIMKEERPEKMGLRRLLQPDKYADTARLMRLQAYDPNRVPVLLVHGLDSTPATWAPMVNALRMDAKVRENCQFWVFSYPSGYPYPYSAALLRKELDGVDRAFPNHKPIVLVGHSMGGMISRLMITDSGDKIWTTLFGKPPEKTHLAGLHRDVLEQSIIFEHRRDVGRVIFMSAPHQGSNLATIWVGRLFASLVRAPKFLADMKDKVTSVLTLDRSAIKLNRMPNSIDTLSPNNRFVKAVAKLPITPGIPYHSIIGDRGRGDTPNSSDGVVPYWSSHLEGAQSEKIVPCGHGSPSNPQAMEEMKRILELHLKNG